MRFAFTDDQRALADAVRDLLGRECPPAVVREGWPGGDRRQVATVWRKLAGMGLAGLLVPESQGGLGLDETFLVAVLEETGRAALPVPIAETIGVAAPLLAAVGEKDLLRAVLAGETEVACELTGDDLVPFAAVAGALLVGDAAGAWIFPAGGAVIEPVEAVDGARRLGRLVCRPAGIAALTTDAGLLDLAWQRGTLGTAAQLTGLARRMLDMTVGYVRQRKQFGVPVGSFQAVKHHLADALLRLEFAVPAVRRAGYSLTTRAPTAGRDVSMAKAMASDAASFVAGVAIQCHGAMGYTVEYDLHLFAKRAWALAGSWGSAAWHRSQVARALGLGPLQGPGVPAIGIPR